MLNNKFMSHFSIVGTGFLYMWAGASELWGWGGRTWSHPSANGMLDIGVCVGRGAQQGAGPRATLGAGGMPSAAVRGVWCPVTHPALQRPTRVPTIDTPPMPLYVGEEARLIACYRTAWALKRGSLVFLTVIVRSRWRDS